MNLTQLLLILQLVISTAVVDMEYLPFAKTEITSKGGARVVELWATETATVLDLRANVGSDAVWLKDVDTSDDELGVFLGDSVTLYSIATKEMKIISIVESCVRGERPGDPNLVEIHEDTHEDVTKK